MGNLPEKKFVSGNVTATVWNNVRKINGKDIEIKSVVVKKVYKENGEWKEIQMFGVAELPKLMLTLGKAYEYLALKNAEESVM